MKEMVMGIFAFVGAVVLGISWLLFVVYAICVMHDKWEFGE